MVWEYFTRSEWGEADALVESLVLTVYSSPLWVIWPLLLSILSLPSMVQVPESRSSMNVAVALPPQVPLGTMLMLGGLSVAWYGVRHDHGWHRRSGAVPHRCRADPSCSASDGAQVFYTTHVEL